MLNWNWGSFQIIPRVSQGRSHKLADDLNERLWEFPYPHLISNHSHQFAFLWCHFALIEAKSTTNTSMNCKCWREGPQAWWSQPVREWTVWRVKESCSLQAVPKSATARLLEVAWGGLARHWAGDARCSKVLFMQVESRDMHVCARRDRNKCFDNDDQVL